MDTQLIVEFCCYSSDSWDGTLVCFTFNRTQLELIFCECRLVISCFFLPKFNLWPTYTRWIYRVGISMSNIIFRQLVLVQNFLVQNFLVCLLLLFLWCDATCSAMIILVHYITHLCHLHVASPSIISLSHDVSEVWRGIHLAFVWQLCRGPHCITH